MKDSLRPYVPMADMLAETFGADCEVVLHDLDDPEHSVVYVANGSVTGRQVGESFDQLVRQVILAKNLKESFVSNYYFTAKNGKRIRSSTLLIKSPDGGLEGALCINLDTGRITAQMEFLQSMMPGWNQMKPVSETEEEKDEHISVMIEHLMDRILGDSDMVRLTREERIAKIRFMDNKGIFLMKGSVEKAAEKLGVNKVTIYSYLDEARGKRGKQEEKE